MTKPLALVKPATRHLSHTGTVLVDSGPLMALFNAADHWHARVPAGLQSNTTAALFSTWPVATEACALLPRRIHNDCASDFLRWAQRGGITLHGAAGGSVTDMLRIAGRFSELPFDLADASIAETAGRLRLRLRLRHVLSMNADFDVYRDRWGRPLINLLRS